MGLITWLIIGGLAGWAASLIMGEDKSMGLMSNIIVGIVGALLGGTLMELLRTGTFDLTNAINGFNISSFLVATLGAVVLLAILKAFKKSPARL
jgi:uncharacterized membrane protein YeaQ/YmgE (transglycosylase-associated protein family)